MGLIIKNLFVINNIFKFHVRNKGVQSFLYEMDKAYVRINDDTFEFTFDYKNPQFNIDRQFNFSRKLSENASTFLGRICTNVYKVISKQKKKNKNATTDINLINDIFLYQNGKNLNGEEICKNIFDKNDELKLKIFDKEYKIMINTPWIKSVSLPSSMLANFLVYPSRIETQFTDRNSSEFTWFKSKDQKEWIEVGKGFLYQPTNEDINSYLKIHCLPRNGDINGPITEVVSTSKVEADPGQCPFEIRHGFTKDKLSGNVFRVVTYNILADLYSDSDYAREVLFSYCPPYALEMDYRKQLILKELNGYNADIICLQEVDEKYFNFDFLPVLSHICFNGEFHKKGDTGEGLACFYNKERFKLLESHSIMLAEELIINSKLSYILEKVNLNENLSKKMSERKTTLQIVLLESAENDEILIVANTHFYFHPDADNIRLLQGATSITYLEDYIDKMQKKYEKRVTLLFCGDFNSTPDCGTYKLFTRGALSAQVPDWKCNPDERIGGIDLTIKAPMFSACGTPQFTNFTAGFQDCLDYIYCQKDRLEVSQVVPLPSHEELTANTAIPSVFFPSDHIALVADLKWCK